MPALADVHTPTFRANVNETTKTVKVAMGRHIACSSDASAVGVELTEPLLSGTSRAISWVTDRQTETEAETQTETETETEADLARSS